MATIKYKYLMLGDSDVNNNQSRGISMQFNGFAPLTFKDPEFDLESYISEQELVPSLDKILTDSRGTLLFDGVSYVSSNGYPVASTSNYSTAIKSPGSFMFKDLNVEAADEFQLIGDEEKVPHGSTVIEIPLSDTMMADRLNGQVRVDAIVLYGQAYNLDFYSRVQQGSLERTIPIGIVYFSGESKPVIDPSSGGKAKTELRVTLGISSVKVPTTAYDENSSYSKWSKIAGSMHVVNDDLVTASSFVVRGRGVETVSAVEPEGLYAEQLYGTDTIDVNSRMLFTNDVDSNEWERNVSFGSPAKLTILDRSEPTDSEDRKPQFVLGKVSYETDVNDYVHGTLEGVHQTYFEFSEDGHKGPVYETDQFSKKKSAISLFSEGTEYCHKPLSVAQSYAGYMSTIDPDQGRAAQYDLASMAANSACFNNGNSLFTYDSSSTGDGTNINTTNVHSRGNSLIMNSSNVISYSKSYDGTGEDDVKYDTLIANSDNVYIYNRVKGTVSNDAGNYTTRALNTVINGQNVSIDNRSVSRYSKDYGRNFVAQSNWLHINNADQNIFIGIKGDASSKYSPSRIFNTKNSVYLGGSLEAVGSFGNFVFGTNHSKPNRINGSTYPERTVSNSLIIGSNCEINTIEGTTSIDEDYQFLFGKGLKTDPRQTEELMDHLHGPSILMGWNNQKYYQPNQRKLVVLGGGSFRANGIPDFKYNSLEVATTNLDDTNPDGLVDRSGNAVHVFNRATVTKLTDIKGRSIDYGSDAVDMKFLKGDRTDENYANYNFKGLGRINMFKLYQLLRRLYWGGDGVVRYAKSSDYSSFSDPTAYQFEQTYLPWSDYDRWNGTIFANLVDDNLCNLPYTPQKPEGH